ncbi:hypothetical protein Q8F55_006264 [Vanrija albida]|uniref:Uncharacterized protein n=1 Tax=Vanrija albida TaxID=181172 RepID=A0ABR3PWP6_9TREE
MPTSDSADKAVARLATVSAHLQRSGVHTRLSDLPQRFEKPLLIPSVNAGDPPVSGSHVLSSWSSPPTSVLIVHKDGDVRVDRAVGQVLRWVRRRTC